MENVASSAVSVRTVTASPDWRNHGPSANTDSAAGITRSNTFQCTDPPDGVIPTRTAIAPVPMLAASTSTDESADAVNRVALFVSAGVEAVGVMAVSKAAISKAPSSRGIVLGQAQPIDWRQPSQPPKATTSKNR